MRRKIMENEENRGRIHKKDFEDQLASLFLSSESFVSLVLGALSLFTLSHTLGDLEFYWSTLGGCGILGFLEKEGKRRVGKCKKASTSTATLDCFQVPNCMYDFLTNFGMHVVSWL